MAPKEHHRQTHSKVDSDPTRGEAKEEEEKVSQCLWQAKPPTNIPCYLRLLRAWPWWQKHAPPHILRLIGQGVPCPDLPPFLSMKEQIKGKSEILLGTSILEDYQKVGAVKLVDKKDARHLVPWFIISKLDGNQTKHRLISDCREINSYSIAKHFKMDHWQVIFPFLKKGMYGAKIDLKDAYFHLPLEEKLRPYVTLKVGDQFYQFNSACFGLNTLPQQWMSIMGVFSKKWRKRGIMVYIYLDDILVLNSSKEGVQKDLLQILKDLAQSGMVINEKKCVLEPTQELIHLGFTLNLKEGLLEVPGGKMKAMRKELGKLLVKKTLTCRKMASILGSLRSFLMAMPFLRSFTDHLMTFVQEQQYLGWDTPQIISDSLKKEVRDLNQVTLTWKGRPFQEKRSIRTLHSDSSNHGWAGIDTLTGNVVQEYWRSESGLHINIKELRAALDTIRSLARPGENVKICVDNTVAHSYLTRGGKITSFQPMDEAILVMANKKQGSIGSRISPLRGRQSRPLVEKVTRSWGLHIKSKFISNIERKFSEHFSSESRYVCLPRKQTIKPICEPISTLASNRGGLFEMSLRQNKRLLCQPPMDINRGLAKSTLEQSPCDMFNDCPPLGFRTMVAPVAKTALSWEPHLQHRTVSGDVSKLLGRINECAKMAPTLHTFVRQSLESSKMQTSDIENFLVRHPALKRYDSSFRMFWGLCKVRGIHPQNATIVALAAQVIALNEISSSHAKNAYAGMVLLPGLDQLRFCPLLKKLKQEWNSSTTRYGTFWDARDVLAKMASQPLDLTSVSQVRGRLILVLRLLQLTRSIDLERASRSISRTGGQTFLLLRRKGHLKPSWEALVDGGLPFGINPCRLLKHYVAITAAQGTPGGPLLLALSGRTALKADTIGSITKGLLLAFGVNTSFWGPHSTRGAGVALYKHLGLSSEQVCEIGKWKNHQAFSEHYLRLNATGAASTALFNWVHNDSLGQSAEPDWSRTPLTEEMGGRDQEGGAQRPSESRYLIAGNV